MKAGDNGNEVGGGRPELILLTKKTYIAVDISSVLISFGSFIDCDFFSLSILKLKIPSLHEEVL